MRLDTVMTRGSNRIKGNVLLRSALDIIFISASAPTSAGGGACAWSPCVRG